jgi:hypothetical protein
MDELDYRFQISIQPIIDQITSSLSPASNILPEALKNDTPQTIISQIDTPQIDIPQVERFVLIDWLDGYADLDHRIIRVEIMIQSPQNLDISLLRIVDPKNLNNKETSGFLFSQISGIPGSRHNYEIAVPAFLYFETS